MDLKSRGALRLAMIVAGVALVGGSGVAVAAADLQPRASRPTTAAPAIRPAPNQYHPAPPQAAVVAPVRIQIPGIGVDAPIEPVGVTAALEMATPTQTADTGWYQSGSAPGQPGDAVIDGHLDTQTGAPAVFARLSQVRPGDALSVTLADGTQVRFKIDRVASVPTQQRPAGLFANDGPARLTLITCSGPWDATRGVYAERLVVDASPSTN